MKNKRFFNISTDGTEGRVDIFGSIGEDWWDENGGNSASKIKDVLEKLKATNCESYHVRINSLGGDVDAALAIHDMIKGLPNVTTECIGFCASAATIIFMAGATRQISKTARFLIHKCSSYAWGNENEIQRTLEFQQSTNEAIVNVYLDCGVDKATVKDLMEANDGQGKWLTASEVKEFGFATEISEGGKATNMVFNCADLKDAHLPIPEDMEEQLSPSLMEAIRNFVSKLIPKNSNDMKKEPATDNAAELQTQLDAANAQLTDVTAQRDDLQNQVTSLTTERDTLQNRVKELEQLLDRHTPEPTPAPNGNDNPANDESATVADYVKNNPAYQAIAKELN